MKLFRPKMYKKNIFVIDYDKLKKKGIKMIIFDVDNTILEVNREIPSEEIIKFIKKLNTNFIIAVASNNIKTRVHKVSESLHCDYLYSIHKPTKKIKKFLDKRYNIPMHDIAIIGDQLITDIFMGNRLGMYTILVDPISNKDLKVTYLNRFLEKRIVMKVIKLKRGSYYEEE